MKSFRTLFVTGLLPILSGCVYLGPPFEAVDQFAVVPSDRSVVVGITHVTLGDEHEKNNVFWDYTRQVINSLPEHQGYLGHKLRKKLFADEAWTMTVWEDEDALDLFVRSSRHGMAMGKGLPAVKSARFVRLILPRAQTPLDWDIAEQMMSDKGRNLY
jgi:heme-degrading monooxygenase HmoA